MSSSTALRPTADAHYVGGRWLRPQTGDTVEIVDPATGEVYAVVPQASVADGQAAIAAARTSFDQGAWSQISGAQRSTVLHGFADALWAHRDELVEAVVRQGGCTVTQARGLQVYTAIELMRRYADLAKRDPIERVSVVGGMFPGRSEGVGHAVALREPAGVVSAITPFNYPFFLNIQKIGPALAAGCSVVLKPTEYTCLDAAILARIADEHTDLPPGVLNVLLGAKGDVGELMSTHPDVDVVTFTGSTQTGRRIMAGAASTIKRVVLELGGKSANIIFEDADLDKVLANDGALVVRHAGQGCGHLTRVLVHESLHDEVVARMVDRAEQVVVGDPMDPATQMGPLVSRAQWDRVKGYIDSGIAQGATLEFGGDRPDGLPNGFFMAPTIFTDVRSDMDMYQDEIFGPVVLVQRFADEDEAVSLANNTIFGLNGAVWSGSLDRGLRVAGRIRTGMVAVNGSGSPDLDMPYGGYKQSGLGREYGDWALQEYTELKTIRYDA